MDASFFAESMAQFAPFEHQPHIAVAVSGGSDSMALCLLAAAWVKPLQGKVTALTVDHHLRNESTVEALQVGSWLASHGIEHHILTWEHDAPPFANIAEAAREARYALLGDWCRKHHVLHLLLAHQQDDVAEHFLMRSLRGSGVSGLAAIPALRYIPGVRILRPLLGCTRNDLQALLHAHHQPWIHDPSNDNTRFRRAQVRKALRAIAEICEEDEALILQRFAASSQHAARATDALQQALTKALAMHVAMHPFRFIEIQPEFWQSLPTELALLGLRHCLTRISQKTPPRFESLTHALNACMEQRTVTLSGCILQPYKGKTLIYREPRAYEERCYTPNDRQHLAPASLAMLERIPKPCWKSVPVRKNNQGEVVILY